jgi:predicted aminopeptidase
MVLPSLRTQIFLMVLFLFSVTGCESAGYYGQAIYGQLSILNKRQPIGRLLAEPKTPEKLKIKLRQVLRIRQFAENELDLPVNDNYLSYVALGRSNVIWNVFAAPEFSLAPKTWCFPIVGCTAYRGYFIEEKARIYAEKLKNAGLDVYVGGVTAYSTLGWFDDPILSTVIDRSESGLAALIFHELAHQVLYADDDTTFNESFATAVEQEGLRRWMTATHNRPAYDDYLRAHRRQTAFGLLVINYRDQLEIIYQKEMPSDEKRKRKALIIEGLRDAYRHLKLQWQGNSGYDRWFREPINNAKINTVSTYHKLVPAFQSLIQHHQGQLKKFYETCQHLVKIPKADRHRELRMTDKIITEEFKTKKGTQ